MKYIFVSCVDMHIIYMFFAPNQLYCEVRNKYLLLLLLFNTQRPD